MRFAYLCNPMPIGLLEHIVKENIITDNFKKIIPSDSLIPHIDCFYIVGSESYNFNQLLFNDGVPTIIFMSSLKSTVRISINGKIAEIKNGWVSGGITRNTYIENISNTDYLLIVRFNPLNFYDFFEVDSRIFKQKCIGIIEEILGTKGYLLTTSVFTVDNINDKIHKIESFIKSFKFKDSSLALLNEAIGLIKAQKGNISIVDVGNIVGANYKWLERKFSNHIGLTPKEFASIQRFIYTYIDLKESTDKNYLSIAVQNGFYDQSHLFRNFKSFVGVSPLQYLNVLKTE